MPYIGNQPQSTNFVTDIFTGDAVTTAFLLSRTPASVTSIIIFIDGVKQSSSGIYTLSGATLNFSAAPPNGTVIEVIHLGVQSLVNVPGSATITTAMLAPDLRSVLADQFTANGTGTTFTLSSAPISANSVIVTANGVVQYDYSVSSSTLILNFTPAVNTLIRVAGIGNVITSSGTIPADDSVSTAKLQNSSVTGPKLADGAVTGPKLGLTAINANNIVDGTITGAKIALGTITGDDIAVGQITGNLLAATVTTGNINLSGTTNFLNSVIESSNVTTVMSATVTINISSPIVVFTANSSANSTVNFSGLAGVPVGNTASFVVIVPNSTSPKYISAYQVDGNSVTPKWQGGAPIGGTSANTDIYSFTVIKTAATPTYNVFASVASFF